MPTNELTMREAATNYGFKLGTVNQWRKRGHFPTRYDERFGVHLVTVADFEAFLTKDRPQDRRCPKSK